MRERDDITVFQPSLCAPHSPLIRCVSFSAIPAGAGRKGVHTLYIHLKSEDAYTQAQ